MADTPQHTAESATAVNGIELVLVTGTVLDATVTRHLTDEELSRINAHSAHPRAGSFTRINIEDPTIEPLSESFDELSEAENIVTSKFFTDRHTGSTRYVLMTKFGPEDYRGSFPVFYLAGTDDDPAHLRTLSGVDSEPAAGTPVTLMVTVRPSYPGGSPVTNLSGFVLPHDYTDTAQAAGLDGLLAAHGIRVTDTDNDNRGTQDNRGNSNTVLHSDGAPSGTAESVQKTLQPLKHGISTIYRKFRP